MPTDTSQDPEKPPQRLLSMIPTFAPPVSQRLDPPLTPTDPTGPSGEPSSPSPDLPTTYPSGQPGRPSPSDDAGTSPRTSTSATEPRLRPGGDPKQVAQAIGGALVIITATLSWLTYRSRGKTLRQPTPEQRDAIAVPLARAAVRHLDLTILGPTFGDLMEATVATHDYLLDGPMTVVPDYGTPDSSTLPHPDDEDYR